MTTTSIRRGLVVAVALAGATMARGEDNVGIFFQGPPPAAGQVAALAPGAAVTVAADGPDTRVTVAWPDVTLSITIDPAWPRQAQLAGIRGWLGRFPPDAIGTPRAKAFLADLDQVTTCWGSVASPGLDAGGKVARLLRALVKGPGGFFFTSAQAFYDASGQHVVGLPGAPPELGAR